MISLTGHTLRDARSMLLKIRHHSSKFYPICLCMHNSARDTSLGCLARYYANPAYRPFIPGRYAGHLLFTIWLTLGYAFIRKVAYGPSPRKKCGADSKKCGARHPPANSPKNSLTSCKDISALKARTVSPQLYCCPFSAIYFTSLSVACPSHPSNIRSLKASIAV